MMIFTKKGSQNVSRKEMNRKMKVTIHQTIKETGPASFEATVSATNEAGETISRATIVYERSHEIYAAYKSLLKALNWLRRFGSVEIELFTNQKSLFNELNGSLNDNKTLYRILTEKMASQNARFIKVEYRE
jgi:ribonuclease HI